MTVFLDANIVMYVIGAPHENRDRSQVLLDQLIVSGTRLVTDVEVFQEILHRYGAINRRDAIEPAFALLHDLVDEVFTVGLAEIETAKDIVLGHGSGARDALHVAAMRSHDVARILTFDRGFDRFNDLERIH
ncbi:MAG: type II toxin-antitoxin system VapC family toxin [Gordonia sp.]|uniref:type II toxin-antitoxin system VapC family toxin n=1 Tax=Gordonia sp. (in: high G+C Gram-positive bacteria) TaxID=84139 RepID=UPI001D585FDB|nr:type II toxin-antitoxin system VapC family toxin [Gordonia sp. (in: high G+C Gram-positive bacteria)]MCB1295989.1 type II toxin-antitoxin system VapC family toxin [Gordonia sp. (in: high G+C Gram-positive bacteria)]